GVAQADVRAGVGIVTQPQDVPELSGWLQRVRTGRREARDRLRVPPSGRRGPRVDQRDHRSLPRPVDVDYDEAIVRGCEELAGGDRERAMGGHGPLGLRRIRLWGAAATERDVHRE